MYFVTWGRFTDSHKLCKHHGIEIKKTEREWNARYTVTSTGLGSRRMVCQRQEEMQREGEDEQKVESSTFSTCIDRSYVSLLHQKRGNVSKTKTKAKQPKSLGKFQIQDLITLLIKQQLPKNTTLGERNCVSSSDVGRG